MGAWDKLADWLPLSNAVAQASFWKDDLQKAENFYDQLGTWGVPENNMMWDIAAKDIIVSRRGLEKAQEKLRKTLKRING